MVLKLSNRLVCNQRRLLYFAIDYNHSIFIRKALMRKIFKTELSKKQVADSGIAFGLILLLIGMFYHNYLFFYLTVVVAILNILFPVFFYPFAVLWLGLTELLGSIISKIILSFFFFLLVVPVGVVRRFAGKDNLRLKEFKKSNKSVFTDRNHLFTLKDLERPF
jgi:hypothetical protein